MSDHTNDPWEAEMSRTFDQRVRDLNEAPLSLDQVKGKAVRIRRTRRLAAAGGALAAAAVIVPVAVFAGGALTDDSGPQPAPQPNPTVTDHGGPGFSYIDGTTLRLPDGSTVELSQRYGAGAVLGDTAYLTVNDDDTGLDRLDVVDSSGQRTVANDLVSGPATNADHTVVAYLQKDGTLTVEGDGFGFGFSTDLGENSYVAAVTGGPDCAVDCRIYVNGEWGTDPLVFDANGDASPVVPGAIKVADADDAGLVAVQNKSTDTGSCWGVYDLAASSYAWETCDNSLFAFSPGSAYVDASHPYLDGFGNSFASILDTGTGDELATFDPPDGTAITNTMWQDDTHLLATVYGPDGWSVFSLSAVDGDVEQVAGPAEGSDFEPAYVLLGGS
jgi:hypothetical protein